MSNQTKDWMERLAKNYKLPDEQPKQKKEPVSILKESQLKIIMARDKKDLVGKK
jgi:Mg2+/Co2+ transporter CorC